MSQNFRDFIEIHLRLKRTYFFLLLGSIMVAVVIGLGFYYYFHHIYDSSTNGSEIKAEIHQKTIPPDVAEKIKKEGSLSAILRVPILMYHYVEYVQDKNDKIRRSLDILPTTLEMQIKTLVDDGYTFLTSGELADAIDEKTKLPAKPILLTFDDGYRDFYTDAFPILKKYNVKATEYIISGFLSKPNHLLTSQLADIIKSGLVEIGAHTIHHVWLKGGTLKSISPEIFQSRVMLEQEFNIHIVSFAYPYGAFDSQVIEVVKAAGFKDAVSTIPGVSQSQANKYFLFRLRPGARTGKILLDFLEQENPTSEAN